MATRKYHWAIPVSDPSNYPHAWRAYAGGYFVQACGRKKKSAVGYPAERFAAKAQRNSDWYCTDCAKAARLALAAESAPKPSDVVWPKPRPISEVSEPYPDILGWCPGFGWLHLFYDAGWVGVGTDDSYEPTHFLPLPPEVR